MGEAKDMKKIVIILTILMISIGILSGCTTSSSPERELYDKISQEIYEDYGYTWDKLGGDFRVESFDDAGIYNQDGFYEVFIRYGLWKTDPFYEGWDSEFSEIYHVKAKKIEGEWNTKEFTKGISDYDSYEDWKEAYDKFYESWE